MSLSAVRKSGRLKTRRKSNHMSNDFEYDEKKFDPGDDTNMEIQTNLNLDISTNISDLIQSHSKEAFDETLHFDQASFPNVLSKFHGQSEEDHEDDLTDVYNSEITDEQMMTCDVCGKMLPDMSSYDRHMKTHSSDRRFLCGQCDKSFFDSCSLKRHLKTHEDDRPFSCEICQKTFRDTGSISRHMLTHTERPRTFQCSVCDKSFTDKCGLKRHERTHTGLRPFICEVCQKSFVDSCSFKRHQKIHAGIKNYHCPTCNRSFMEKQSLVRHQKTVCKFSDDTSDLKPDSNDASSPKNDSLYLDHKQDKNSSQTFLVDGESSEYSIHSNNNSFSTPDSILQTASVQLVSTDITTEIKPVKGQPSLGSMMQKDPGLYDSISEIVESIDSYEKMLDLCGDQGQKEIDAALTRDCVPLPNNLLCFECGEVLVDGVNFKSEGKLFHASMTNAFKCLNCEAAEDDNDEDQYGEPPVLMPHYDDVDAEENVVQDEEHMMAGSIEVDNSFQMSYINGKETDNLYGTSEPIDQFQDCLESVSQSNAIPDDHSTLNFIPMSLSSNPQLKKSKKSKRRKNKHPVQFEMELQSIVTNSSIPADSNQTEDDGCSIPGSGEDRSQLELDYEADDPTIPSVFPCHLCTKVFASASFLAQHLSLHRKSPHKCMVCTKSFTSGPALKRHLRLHTGEKPYACPICQKQFRDPSNFGKHRKHCGVNRHAAADFIFTPTLLSADNESLPNPDLNLNTPGSNYNDNLDQSSSVTNGDIILREIFDERNNINSLCKDGEEQNSTIRLCNDVSPDALVRYNGLSAITSDFDEDDVGREEESGQVMAVMPSLDDDDDIDVDTEQGIEDTHDCSAQNILASIDDKAAEVESETDKKQTGLIACDLCQKLCENQDHLDMHMNYHNANPNVTCIECGKSFADAFGLKRHMRTHLGIRPYTCEYCNRGYCDNWSLKKHKSKGCVKSEVKVPIDLLHPCPKCTKVFCEEDDLQTHIKIHKGLMPMKYQCDVCHKRFSEAFNLKKHRRLHMAICSGCGQEFSNIQLLTLHQESECTAALPSKEDADSIEEEKSFSCDICGRAYSTRSYLERHRKIHSEIKPHVCEICNKRFAEAFKLRRHKKAAHSDEKPFICQDCGKCFSDDGALKRHAVLSSCALSKVIGGAVNNENCACQFCGKVFAKNYMLVRHMTVHSQSRPFACELCGRSYKDTSSLKRHQLTHQGVKDFICPNCGAEFYYSDSLKRHMSGRCGKKTKTRRRKAVSWTRPKPKRPYPKHQPIPNQNVLSSNNNDNDYDIDNSENSVYLDKGTTGVFCPQKTKLHTSAYIPTIIPVPDPSASFSIPPAENKSIKEGKWSCRFKGHCWLCDAKADSETALAAHRKRVHRNKKRFACPKCFFRLHKKVYWKAHASSAHSQLMPSHYHQDSTNAYYSNNNDFKLTRKRTLAASVNDSVPVAASTDGVVDEVMEVREGKRPRRSVPRAKWSWISQI